MTGEDRTKSRRTVLEALGLAGTVGLTGVTAGMPGRSPGPREREVLIGMTGDAHTASVEARVSDTMPSGAQISHRNQDIGYMAVELPEQASTQAVEATARAMENRPGVDYVEQNATFEIQLAPNDPQFDRQYAPQQVNAPTAWDTTTGSSDVTVAVIDTGAQYDHPDLSGPYAGDPGRDFVDDDNDPYPGAGSSHGTHVSGCASSDIDNGEGTTGISDSQLISARSLGGSGSGSLSNIADGIQWAVDAGADIINMSLGGGGYTNTMKRAVEYAYDQNDVLIVCAAGNSSRSSVSYPSAYDECVSVSALDPDENLASFSNYGDGVEVAAPGVNVRAPYPTDRYADLSGTSMASPVAAGVAALGLAADPDLSASQLRDRLKSTAVDVGLAAREQGAGRVDAAAIVGSGDGGSGGDGDDGGGGGDGGDGSLSGYRLVNGNSGLALDVDGNSASNGADLVQQAWAGESTQDWAIEGLSNGSYRIVNNDSGKVADVYYAQTFRGARVVQYDWNGGANQRWEFYGLGGGEYAIRNVNSGLYLTADGASASAGENMIQWPWYGGAAQKWALTDL